MRRKDLIDARKKITLGNYWSGVKSDDRHSTNSEIVSNEPSILKREEIKDKRSCAGSTITVVHWGRGLEGEQRL